MMQSYTFKLNKISKVWFKNWLVKNVKTFFLIIGNLILN